MEVDNLTVRGLKLDKEGVSTRGFGGGVPPSPRWTLGGGPGSGVFSSLGRGVQTASTSQLACWTVLNKNTWSGSPPPGFIANSKPRLHVVGRTEKAWRGHNPGVPGHPEGPARREGRPQPPQQVRRPPPEPGPQESPRLGLPPNPFQPSFRVHSYGEAFPNHWSKTQGDGFLWRLVPKPQRCFWTATLFNYFFSIPSNWMPFFP